MCRCGHSIAEHVAPGALDQPAHQTCQTCPCPEYRPDWETQQLDQYLEEHQWSPRTL